MNSFISLVSFIFIFALVSCDSPQRTRTPYGTYTSTPVSSSSGDSATDDGTSSSGNTTDNSGTDTTPTTTGFENCTLSYNYNKENIGRFGVCQSTLDDSKFKLKMESSDSSEGTCFVPIRRNTDGTSFKLGIGQCVNNEAGREYTMTLTKERSEKINGIFVVKHRALGPYMACMNAKQEFYSLPTNHLDQSCYYDSYGNPSYYAHCVCNKFVSAYRNYYLDVVSFPLNN